jgi:hypothetical protein
MLTGFAAVAFLAAAVVIVAGFTDVYGPYYSNGGETIGPPTLKPEVTGTARSQLDATLAGAVTHQQEDVSFTIAALKGILITVSGNATTTVVLKTNSSGSPDNTFTFPIGGGELLWTSRSPATIPFGAAVTTTFWSHAGSETVTVKLRALYNA